MIPLLELAKLGGEQNSSFETLATWGGLHMEQPTSSQVAQIVAWNDANDLLTWYLAEDFQQWQAPSNENVYVQNFAVRNASHWLILEGPLSAHDNYAKNRQVIRSLFKPK